ncbi:hypothetical protein Trco_008288 [Trichoderma cornu-damae]|uniref:Uncharacterized protein n=1 Tax=Trichoderma cornu-damae TaxID=654480 RepID=A0A9P8QIE1_9HYPO|nr:hypothetical protein Trco_008288 [Trichoderma cornu-damae]
MSWTVRSQEALYRDFTDKAADESPSPLQQPWSLDVCDVSQDGQLREYVQTTVRRLNGRPRLRIVFAPSDVPRRETTGLMIELFHKFGIPHDFTAERARSTNHSFSRRSGDGGGFSSWFRFSCICCELAGIDDGSPDAAALPAKYADRQSAFFLEASKDTSVTLVCFGAGPGVRKRMKELTKSQGWTDVGVNPYVLFDAVLEGLHEEVDNIVWKMEEEFAPLERSVVGTGSTLMAPLRDLHYFERHMADLARALESATMIGEGVLLNAGTCVLPTASPAVEPSSSTGETSGHRRSLVDLQLRECLEYRRTLLRSTQLRLSGLQKRIKTAAALASDVEAQRRAAASMQGPVSMKIIAASIMLFLPTIAVATIAGSQLLLTEQRGEEDSWNVSATPLFYLLWYISIPLTLAVIMLSLAWLWWRQGGSRKAAPPSSWLRKAVTWRRAKGKRDDNEGSSVPV